MKLIILITLLAKVLSASQDIKYEIVPGIVKKFKSNKLMTFKEPLNFPVTKVPYKFRSSLYEICDIESGLVMFHGECYQIHSEGPCPPGFWIILNESGKPLCSVKNSTDSRDCIIERGQILVNGKCRQIFSSESCPHGYWIILDIFGDPRCSPRPCSVGEIYYNNECVSLTDVSSCEHNEMLYMDFHGNASCDCQPYAIYDINTKSCIFEHKQEYCPFGQYIEKDEKGVINCLTNPCLSDNLIFNNSTERCYNKTFISRCKGEGYHIKFHDKGELNGTAECVNLVIRGIFQVPTVQSCPEGSKRDHLDNCKGVVSMRSFDSFSYRVPSRITTNFVVNCPSGFVRYPNGSCQKPNKFLGK